MIFTDCSETFDDVQNWSNGIPPPPQGGERCCHSGASLIMTVPEKQREEGGVECPKTPTWQRRIREPNVIGGAPKRPR